LGSRVASGTGDIACSKHGPGAAPGMPDEAAPGVRPGSGGLSGIPDKWVHTAALLH